MKSFLSKNIESSHKRSKQEDEREKREKPTSSNVQLQKQKKNHMETHKRQKNQSLSSDCLKIEYISRHPTFVGLSAYGKSLLNRLIFAMKKHPMFLNFYEVQPRIGMHQDELTLREFRLFLKRYKCMDKLVDTPYKITQTELDALDLLLPKDLDAEFLKCYN